MNTTQIQQFLTRWSLDPRIWILVLFVLRLETINLPPMDGHAFRQCFTLGVSRSYAEVDANFMHPRQLIVGDTDGLGPMEFPAFNYLIAMLWKIFGQHPWCFRLLGVVVASLGLWHFHSVLRRFMNPYSALAGMVIFGCGLSYIYARKAIPDVFGISMVLMSVRFGWDYIEKGLLRHWWLFVVLGIIGFLNKVSTIGCFSLLILPLIDRNLDNGRKLRMIGGGGIIIAAFAAWYYLWIPWAEQTYNSNWFFPHDWRTCIDEVFHIHWHETKERFCPIALQSQIPFWACVMGVLMAVILKNAKMLILLLSYSALFLVFISQVGHNFSQHEYYILPYTPMMAIMAGYFLGEWMTWRWLFFMVLIIGAWDAIRQKRQDFFIPWSDSKFTQLEAAVDSVVPKEALIYTNGMGGNQVILFFAHRRGWQDDKIPDSTWFANKTKQGLGYAVIERSANQDSLPYPMLLENNDFRIYKVK
jgi:hypothetical protein